MELTWLPGPAICAECETVHRDGLPAIWWKTRRATPVCRACRAKLERLIRADNWPDP